MANHPDIQEVLLTEEDIASIIKHMGTEITEDYKGKNPLVIAVLRGAVVFFSDLARAIKCPMAMDFMAVSSYSGVKSSGVVRIQSDLNTEVTGRHVLIAEDILDSGLTLDYLIGMLRHRGAASVEVAAFTVKDIPGYQAPVTPRYVGAHVPDAFVVGYGLDYNERYRNLPYLGVLKPEVYS